MVETKYFCIYKYDIKSTIKEVDAGSDISILCTSKQKLSNLLKKRLYAFLVGRAREFNTSSNVTAEYFPVEVRWDVLWMYVHTWSGSSGLGNLKAGNAV